MIFPVYDALLDEIKDGATAIGSLTGMTAGAVPFGSTTGGLTEDASNLFWDDANNRLGVGTATPLADLDIFKASPESRLTSSGDSEYSRVTRTDTGSVAQRFNRVSQPASDSFALDFGGLNERVLCGTGLDITGDITISAWFKFSLSQTNKPLVAKWGSAPSYTLIVYPSNKIAFFGRVGGVNKVATTVNTYNDGLWHHVVGRFDGVNLQIYIDGGTEDVTGTATAGPFDTATSEQFAIGGYSTASGSFTGEMDEVAIWDRYLSDNDLNDLYNSGAGLYVDKNNTFPTDGGSIGTNLQGLWHLDEGTGISTADSSGNGNTGTLQLMEETDWVAGHIAGVDSIVEASVWKSQDGTLTGESGIQTFGDGSGRLILDGSTLRFNIGSTEFGQMDSNGNLDLTKGFSVTGSSDEIQMLVAANSTQTANLSEWQQSDGTVVSAVTKNGYLSIEKSIPLEKLDLMAGAFRFSYLDAPDACVAALAGVGAGNVPNGSYVYRVTFVNKFGQSIGGTISNSVTVVDNSVNGQVLVTAPISADSSVTKRRLWRSDDGGTSWRAFNVSNTLNDNVTTSYTDNLATPPANFGVYDFTVGDDSGVLKANDINAFSFDSAGNATAEISLVVNGGRKTDNSGTLALGVGINATNKSGIFVADNFAQSSSGAYIASFVGLDALKTSNNIYGGRGALTSSVAINTAGSWMVNMQNSVPAGNYNTGTFRAWSVSTNTNNTGASYGYVCHNYLQDNGAGAQHLDEYNAFYSFGQNAVATTSLTDQYDFRAANWSVPTSGVITNRYGLYIEFPSTGITNPWGVYQKETSVNNHFNGSVLIGSTTNSAKLFVSGTSDEIQMLIKANSTQTANLSEWQDSAGVNLLSITPTGGLLSESLEQIATTNTSGDFEFSVKAKTGEIARTGAFVVYRTSSVNGAQIKSGSMFPASNGLNLQALEAGSSIGIVAPMGSGSSSITLGGFSTTASNPYINLINASQGSRIGVRIVAHASQTADIFVIEKSDGTNYLAINSAGDLVTDSTDTRNTWLGVGAGNEAGINNTGIGFDALKLNTGSKNIALGSYALTSNIVGVENTAVGYQTLQLNTNSYNTAIGDRVLYKNTSGSGNCGLGRLALGSNQTGNSNMAVGPTALFTNISGAQNVAIGNDALRLIVNTHNNVAIGYQCGYTNTGTGNVFIGYKAAYNEIGSNKLYIDNSNTATPLIYGEFDNDILIFNGEVETTSGIKRQTTRVTATYTILATDHHIFANTDGGAFTSTLPAGVEGTEYRIINTGTSGNALTVTPNGAENLLGSNSSFTLADGESLLLIYNASDGWF